MNELKNIIDNSGDSVLQDYNYYQGVLTLFLNVKELQIMVKLKIRTDILSINSFYLDKQEELYRTCRIEIHDLSDVLNLENNIYIPSNEFKILMKECKMNYNLAYGKKASELRYIFTLIGYDRIVSCIIPDLDFVSVEVIN